MARKQTSSIFSTADGRPGSVAYALLAGVTSLGLCLVFSSAALLAQSIPRFRIKEERARDYFKKGLTFHNTQRYVAAREFYYKALDIQPYFHLARRYLGDAYYYSGEWNSALEQWEFLDSLSDGAYPLVRQRSELLRFSLNPVYDPGDLTYFNEVGPTTWTDAPFEHPVDVAWDSENNLYILAFTSAKIIKVNPGGRVLRQFSGPLWDPLRGPIAMFLYGGRIYVADYLADRIRVFGPDGAALSAFGTAGNGPGQFRGPAGILVTEEAIYVSDSGNRRVQKFDHEGKFLLSFGQDDLGQPPRYPAGIALDDEGVLFVADRDQARISRYDTDGNYLGTLTSALMAKPRGLHYRNAQIVVADEEKGILFFNTVEQEWRPIPELRDDQDRPIVPGRVFSARTSRSGILVAAEYGTHRVLTSVPRGLLISTYDCRVQRVDTGDFPAVGVFLTVRNRLGDSLIGLTSREIRVFENDKPIGGIRTDNVDAYNHGANIAVTVENSPVMAAELRQYFPGIMNNLLTPLRVTDEVAVVRVGPTVQRVYEGQERREIIRQMSEGDPAESPNLGKGFIESLTYLLPEIGPRSVLLIVSGKEFPEAFLQYEARRIVQYARSQEIAIHVISFEAEDDPDAKEIVKAEYRQMAEHTGGKYYFAFDDTALKNIFQEITGLLDRRYVLTYKSRDDAIMKGRYVDVRVEVEYLGTFGKANSGYFVPDE